MLIRRTRRRLAAALTVAAALAAGVPGATAAPLTASETPRPAGLDGDVAAFAAATGLSVTAARDYTALTTAVEDLGAAARAAHPATFGGLHRDPGTGLVTLSFTRDGTAAAARLTAAFPRPDLVRVRRVDHSLAALDAALAEVTADVPALRTATGGALAYAYVDVPANAVTVAFTRDVARHARLLAPYGAAVRAVRGDAMRPAATVPDACTSRELCTPYARGGLEMYDAGYCTSGFGGWKGGRPVIVTAGHCFALNRSVDMGGAPLGSVTARQFSGTVDGETVSLDDPWITTNWVFWTAFEQRRKIYGIASADAVGNSICRVGRTTGSPSPYCGTITSTNATIIYPQVTMTSMRMGSTCALPGDSGGPVLWNNTAHGVLSGGNHVRNADGTYSCNATPFIAWSGIVNVQNALGVTIRTWD